MLKIFDFECSNNHITESIVDSEKKSIRCPVCNKRAEKIISFGRGSHTLNEDSEWIRTVREVVDKDGGPACQEFLKNPTRTNRARWMKAEGLRSVEPGEKLHKFDREADHAMRVKYCHEQYRNRHRIELNG